MVVDQNLTVRFLASRFDLDLGQPITTFGVDFFDCNLGVGIVLGDAGYFFPCVFADVVARVYRRRRGRGWPRGGLPPATACRSEQKNETGGPQRRTH